MSAITGPTAQVDLTAIIANWRALAARRPQAQASAVVKADAYGLGARQVANALNGAGCSRFYVATFAEGIRLRDALLRPEAEIAVFHGVQAGQARMFVRNRLTPVLNSLDQVRLWMAEGDGQAFCLHVDTGMNRLGLPARDWDTALKLLGGASPSHLLSHLACADEPGHPMNTQQRDRFLAAAQLWPQARRSLSASAGALLDSSFGLDEIRPGIALYGGGPVASDGWSPRNVLTLRAPVLQVREPEPGETTGYGASFTAGTQTRLACVELGYADGFLRSGSNRGYAVVAGERRPIAGRVSMDLVMVDVTGLDVSAGDQVEFIGPALPLEEQATQLGTVGWELLSRLGPRVRRSYGA